MAKRRLVRIAAEMKHALGEILTQELTDPRLRFMTITKVEPAVDFRSARVHVSVLGTDAQAELTLRGLRHARGHIQHLLSERIVLRTTPILDFVLDESIKRSVRISQLIQEADRED